MLWHPARPLVRCAAPLSPGPRRPPPPPPPPPQPQFFQVSSADVAARLVKIAVPVLQTGPLKGTFLRMTLENPDLYGPFWVTSTLVFALGVAANMFAWFNTTTATVSTDVNALPSATQKYNGDVASLTLAAGICYAFLLLLPLAVWVESMVFGLVFIDNETQTSRTLSLANVMCLTGYSMLIYIPLSLFCVIPGVVTTIPLFLAALHATVVTGIELWPLLRRKTEAEAAYAQAVPPVQQSASGAGGSDVVATIATLNSNGGSTDEDNEMLDEELGGIEGTSLAGEERAAGGAGALSGAQSAVRLSFCLRREDPRGGGGRHLTNSPMPPPLPTLSDRQSGCSSGCAA